MLYERWRSIAAQGGKEIALRDLPSGRRWTFAELWAVGESWPADSRPVLFPQGNTPEFIFALLAAWRTGAVACPLEPGQSLPHVATPPPPCVHLKATSATTGTARWIAFTGPQLAADAANIVNTMRLRPDWPNLGVISLAHSYGFSNLVLPLLLHGIPLLLCGQPLPEIVRGAAAAEPHVTLPAVPALWRVWHEARAIPAHVRLAISAGAPLPASLEAAVFQADGIKIHNFYGSTECGGIAYDATAVPRQDDACVGTPMKNVHLSVTGEGCLEVRSQAVGETYWPDASTKLDQGVFHTSDLVEFKDGAVFLRGRLGDQINIAGRKLDPATLERSLREHSAIVDCLAFGVPGGDGRGETIVMCYHSRPGVTSGELRRFLLERLPAWQVPRRWWPVDSLSANQRGKLSRLEWRRRFLEEHPRSEFAHE
jgi:acyl-CoA synthetase (AMP-forming)/AMP-acid ligase II